MAPLTNQVAKLLYELPYTVNLEDLRTIIYRRANKLVEEADEKRLKTIQKAIKYLGNKDSGITISYSKTVKETIQKLQKLKVIISESRPLLEGQKLAEDLAECGIHVTLIIDAAIGSFIEKAEVAFTGADSILNDGAVINKVGTNLLALAAKDRGIPFYSICSTVKFNLRENRYMWGAIHQI